jgi:putative membrane protein
MMWLTHAISDAFDLGVSVDGFWAAFVGALVVSIVSVGLSFFVGIGAREHPARRTLER